MHRLIQLVDRAVASRENAWTRRGRTVTVRLGQTARGQAVRLAVDGSDYVLSSVVLPSAAARRPKRRRQLAVLAWQRNAQHQIVTFAFDRQDRLVGQIRHPRDTLDLPELELYVNVLARDCDRFEYLLTGGDRY